MSIADREHRLQQVSESLYLTVFREITNVALDENEVRYFVLHVVKKLITGVDVSLRNELVKADLQRDQELRSR